MKRIVLYVFSWVLLFNTFTLNAQRNCASNEVLQQMLIEHPEMLQNREKIERQTADYVSNSMQSKSRAVVTIPVVFHIVWRTGKTAENISDAQIQSQLDVINKDFRKLNADASSTPSLFSALVADSEINFCLAQRTPSGTATNGIVRYQSSRTTDWGTNNAVKSAYPAWNSSKYLNIWVCSIGSGILGYAQFPGGPTSTDGVVIDYRYTGLSGSASAPYNLGRTLTHEIGHYFNLYHIWGDANCGNDQVADTPIHTTDNGGCPVFPKNNSCGGTLHAEMTMNYMDYTNDACMYMFSTGQKERMQALFATGAIRASLVNSDGCQPPTSTGTCSGPGGLSSAAITSTSATLSWSVASGATAYSLQYKTSSATTWTTLSVNGTSQVLTGLIASTTYNYRVASNCAGTLSAYSNAASFNTSSVGTVCTDIYESNNTSATAFTLSPGTTISAAISTTADIDWFKITTTASQKKIKVTLSNLSADYDLELYNSNLKRISSSAKAGTTTEVVKFNTGATGATYFVKVFGYGGAFSASNCYSLLPEISASNFRSTTDDAEIDALKDDTFDYSIVPNPASNEIFITTNEPILVNTQISIFDLTGRTLVRKEVMVDDLSNIPLDVSVLDDGIYIVNIFSGKSSCSKKLIINKGK